MLTKVYINEHSQINWRKFCKLFLALSWHFGLLCGVLITDKCDPDLLSLMRSAVLSRVSIVGLLAVTFLPFLLSAFAVIFSSPWLMIPISFLKAFSFGYCASAVSTSFGSAGWLVRWLLLFSACCSVPVLYWFWLRHISGSQKSLWMDLVLCAVIVLLIGCLDYRVISPFLVKLL